MNPEYSILDFLLNILLLFKIKWSIYVWSRISTLLILLLLLTSLIWVILLAICLPCPLHTWCQSWRGQDQEGPPVRPECCTHMCHGISPRCHLCGWWCRWTRRWCPSAFWRRCGTGSSHIWHHCGKQDCECYEYHKLFFRNRIPPAPNLSIMWTTKLQQLILSARPWLAKFYNGEWFTELPSIIWLKTGNEWC